LSQHVGDQREAGRVRLRKAVFGKAANLFKDGFGEAAVIAALAHAGADLVVEFFQSSLPLPRGHCATQAVSLAGGKAGGHHRDLHYLLLEDRDTESEQVRALTHAGR
jgi:hypothetical protein